MGVGKVHYLCDACWEQIELLKPPWCQICGLPGWSAVCADCDEHPPLFRSLRAIAFYEPTLREAVHLMKYEKKEVISKHLIQLLQAHLPEDLGFTDYDFLLPIPLHTNRLRQRGFNQAEQIAQGVAQAWGVPVRTDVLFRIRDTVPLSSLESHEERMKNIAGAFEVRSQDSIQSRKILLIDDIFTTGTTTNEALKALQVASPDCVDVLTLTRTRPSG
jgi:ComF family protein